MKPLTSRDKRQLRTLHQSLRREHQKQHMATKSSNGLGLGTILFLIFLVLKLTGYIDWSWWWIMAPIWIPVAILIGIILVAYLMHK